MIKKLLSLMRLMSFVSPCAGSQSHKSDTTVRLSHYSVKIVRLRLLVSLFSRPVF